MRSASPMTPNLAAIETHLESAQYRQQLNLSDEECGAWYANDVSALLTLLRQQQAVIEVVRKELGYYDSAWIAEHAKDDYMNTLDHKDELSLMETLQALQDALTHLAQG